MLRSNQEGTMLFDFLLKLTAAVGVVILGVSLTEILLH
jgi:hypothetical protein